MRVTRLLFWLAFGALLLPALPLTLNRLIDSSAGPAVRIQSFTPLAVPLYVVALLMLVVALILGHAGPRRTVAGVLVALLVPLGAHLWWLAPAFVGDNPRPAAGSTPLVVLNANLYAGAADADQLVEVIETDDVQVAVFEEITFGALRALEAAGIDDLLPFRVGEPNGAVDGTMVFARDPLTGATRLPTNFQSWQVEVSDPDGGDDPLTLIAAHPTAPVAMAASTWQSEHRILRAAAESAGADLVLGDLNASSDHAEMRAWYDAGWADSLERVNAGWSPTWPSNGITPFPGVSPPALFQLDHVLVGPRLSVTDSRTIVIAGSDHRAVIATVARR